jgi:hypothetical protein
MSPVARLPLHRRNKGQRKSHSFCLAFDAAITSQFHVANEHQFLLSQGVKHAAETERKSRSFCCGF